jgi:hypothetical protein
VEDCWLVPSSSPPYVVSPRQPLTKYLQPERESSLYRRRTCSSRKIGSLCCCPAELHHRRGETGSGILRDAMPHHTAFRKGAHFAWYHVQWKSFLIVWELRHADGQRDSVTDICAPVCHFCLRQRCSVIPVSILYWSFASRGLSLLITAKTLGFLIRPTFLDTWW